ncbi:unnamed protein product [Camellia sinensis]
MATTSEFEEFSDCVAVEKSVIRRRRGLGRLGFRRSVFWRERDIMGMKWVICMDRAMGLEHMRGPVVGLLWWTLAIASLHFSFCNGNSTVSCIAKERQALMRFKDDLTDPSSWLSSWSSNEDCCSWDGVVCDPSSGHVRELHLQGLCTDYSDSMCYDRIPKLGECRSNETSRLRILILRENLLSGKIPGWMNWQSIEVINLRNNNLKGSIPSPISFLINLISLQVRNNSLSGEFPPSLQNCTKLSTIDLDLADNKLIGTIPWCILENEFAVTEGHEYQYSTILPLLTRMIPKKIGYMKLLDSIDLSRNQLSGKIPSSMSNLNFLGYLDISYNNLSGKIPTSTQLQSFNASSFVGNKLYGPPLTQKCSADGEPVNNGENKVDKREPDVDWFYLCMALGFVMGFGGVCVPLLLFKSWR